MYLRNYDALSYSTQVIPKTYAEIFVKIKLVNVKNDRKLPFVSNQEHVLPILCYLSKQLEQKTCVSRNLKVLKGRNTLL
jgi:hypothetical protein